jgi:hypothetical protein
LVAVVIALLGLIRVCVDISSARSYLTLSLLLTTLTLSAWQPTLVYLLFIPLALLVTVGIETLIRQWYDLFPRNPYARVLAIVPLTIMIAGLGWTSIARFNLSQSYDVSTVYNYSQEFSAARQEIATRDGNAVLVVSRDDEQRRFYEILQRDFPNLKVATEPQKDARNIVLGSAGVLNDTIPDKIVTNWHSQNAVLLRVYDAM